MNVMFLITSTLSLVGSTLTLMSSFKVNIKNKPTFHLVTGVVVGACADEGAD